MSRQKMCGAVLLLLLLISVVLVGCQSGKDLPFYPMEDHEYNSESLYIDGVQYVRKQELDECARYYSGIKYAWTPAEGIGEQIGVCGDEATQHKRPRVQAVLTGPLRCPPPMSLCCMLEARKLSDGSWLAAPLALRGPNSVDAATMLMANAMYATIPGEPSYEEGDTITLELLRGY